MLTSLRRSLRHARYELRDGFGSSLHVGYLAALSVKTRLAFLGGGATGPTSALASETIVALELALTATNP
ncbi:MAG: hypothetical protein ACHREM_10995 [Polyangiales bacterium]